MQLEDFTPKEHKQVKSIAYSLARKMHRAQDLDDYKQCGYLGLMDAKQKFDSKRGYQLNTYAKIRIYGAIIDGMRRTDQFSRSRPSTTDEPFQCYSLNDDDPKTNWRQRLIANTVCMEQIVYEHEIRKIINKEISYLPRKMRTIVYLYYYKNVGMLDIAKMLGCTEGRISQIVTMARKRLRGRLRQCL
jgi:RNA polymerase sigma factor for flagellar operon FliA